ncbi:MAG: hypothetical protein ACP6IQ_02035 [Candidatus Njordarchaeia archaeon]
MQTTIYKNKSGLTKVRRLKKLAKEYKRISFLVHCPGTKHERKYHAVQLKDFKVWRSKEGNYIITGRDLEEELKEYGPVPPRGHRPKSQMIFRSYRIDRILPRTIIHN